MKPARTSARPSPRRAGIRRKPRAGKGQRAPTAKGRKEPAEDVQIRPLAKRDGGLQPDRHMLPSIRPDRRFRRTTVSARCPLRPKGPLMAWATGLPQARQGRRIRQKMDPRIARRHLLRPVLMAVQVLVTVQAGMRAQATFLPRGAAVGASVRVRAHLLPIPLSNRLIRKAHKQGRPHRRPQILNSWLRSLAHLLRRFLQKTGLRPNVCRRLGSRRPARSGRASVLFAGPPPGAGRRLRKPEGRLIASPSSV